MHTVSIIYGIILCKELCQIEIVRWTEEDSERVRENKMRT